jgi:hypothetical protein
MMNNRANRFAGAQFRARKDKESRCDSETEEQYQSRLLRDRQAREAAAARRKAEEAAMKQQRQREREKGQSDMFILWSVM